MTIFGLKGLELNRDTSNVYRPRKQTVEPVFGSIKNIMVSDVSVSAGRVILLIVSIKIENNIVS